jgi:hypothetical protein
MNVRAIFAHQNDERCAFVTALKRQQSLFVRPNSTRRRLDGVP